MQNRNRLFDCLPPIFENIREFQCIFDAVAAALNRLSAGLSQCAANRSVFADGINQAGIDRWGQALKLNLDGLSFDEKIFEIKTRLLEQRPYNIARIKGMLEKLCGKDGYQFDVDPAGQTVHVKLALAQKANFDSVKNLLERVIPANMALNIVIMYNVYDKFAGTTHDALTESTHEKMRSDLL
ncbi:MAG: DUF2313 domain-containing protein [Clostridia bacterium]|nr:DUF2313 domain-containing protein [Clostridia bacterium]